jgi:hypothetical protein
MTISKRLDTGMRVPSNPGAFFLRDPEEAENQDMNDELDLRERDFRVFLFAAI